MLPTTYSFSSLLSVTRPGSLSLSPSRPEQSLTFNPSIQSTDLLELICYLYPFKKTHWDSVFFFLRLGLNFKQCLTNCSFLSLPPTWSSAPSPPPVSLVIFVKWGGISSLSGFDNFYGSDYFSGSPYSTTIIEQQQEVVCHSESIEIIQQRLLVLQETAKRSVLNLF